MAKSNTISLAILAFVLLSLLALHGCVVADEIPKLKPVANRNGRIQDTPPQTPCQQTTCVGGAKCWCCAVKGVGYCYPTRQACLSGCGCQPATCGSKAKGVQDIKCYCCTLYGKITACFPSKPACVGSCGNP